jgi:hypothetical protein
MQRPLPPVRPHKPSKGLADARHGIAFADDPSVQLFQDGQARDEIVFEIVIKVENKRDAVFSGQGMADDPVKRIGTGPDNIHILGHSLGFRNEEGKADELETASIYTLPQDRPIGDPTSNPRPIAQAKSGDPVTHPRELQRNFAKAPETVVDQIFAHILAFGQYQDVQGSWASIIVSAAVPSRASFMG